jgi:PadR family transcriptional regulator, regulatory protein AphA
MARGLTTTSYAILGQLAWGEAGTYELVKAMRRNLRYMWPRAESRIYAEVKRLDERGLVSAHAGASGERRRVSYRITELGRQALREWLTGPPGGIALEHEPLLRVFLGAEGAPQDLLRAIRATREHAEEMLARGQPLAEEYLGSRHPQQHEVHLRALSFDYLYRWALMNLEWAERAEREVLRWDGTAGNPAREARALSTIRAALRARRGA